MKSIRDTGADYSCVTSKLVEKLKLEVIEENVVDLMVLDANDNPLEIVGKTVLTVNELEHEFLIIKADHLGELLIIGKDLLSQLKETKQAFEQLTSAKLVVQKKSKDVKPKEKVRFKKNQMVNGNTIEVVEVEGYEEGEFHIPFREVKPGVAIIEGLVKTEKDKKNYICVMNYTGDPIRIRKSWKINAVLKENETTFDKITEGDKSRIMNIKEMNIEEKNRIMKLIETIKLPIWNNKQVRRLKDLLKKYYYVFSSGVEYNVGCTPNYESAEIELKEEFKNKEEIRKYPYRTSHWEKEQLELIINEFLRNEIVEDAPKSRWSFPVILVAKPSGGLRFCIDYRELNKRIKLDNLSVPICKEQLEDLRGDSVFTTLDLLHGFYNIPLAEQSRDFTTFITHLGKYRFRRLPMGVSIAPGVVQDFTTGMIRRAGLPKKVVVTIDDLLIHSKNFDEALIDLENTLKAVAEENVRLKFSKCKFMATEATYLAHEISAEGIKPSQKKIEAIINLKEPTNVKEVRMFMGMINFYRRFFDKFAVRIEPITRLLKKDVAFEWKEEQQKAWKEIKEQLKKQAILSHPDFEKKFYLRTDASGIGMASILFQEDDNAKPKILCFNSGVFKGAQVNYSVSEKEMLAIQQGILKNRSYLHNAEVVVKTDHKPLCYMDTWKEIYTSRVLKMLAKINNVVRSLKIEHVEGKMNVDADVLSRLLLVKSDIINYSGEDLKEAKRLKLKKVGETYVFNVKVFVPNRARLKLLKKFHDNYSHIGMTKMKKLLNAKLYWPKMEEQINDYVLSCDICQRRKINRVRDKGVSKQTREQIDSLLEWHLDFVGPLKQSDRGNKHILVATDRGSKWIITKALRTNGVDGVIPFIQNRICNQFGNPQVILADRGSAFTGNKLENWCHEKKIKLKLTTTENAASNGLTERNNATIVDLIRCSIDDEATNWDEVLDEVVWRINSTYQSTLKCSPFEKLFGKKARNELDELVEDRRVTDFEMGGKKEDIVYELAIWFC